MGRGGGGVRGGVRTCCNTFIADYGSSTPQIKDFIATFSSFAPVVPENASLFLCFRPTVPSPPGGSSAWIRSRMAAEVQDSASYGYLAPVLMFGEGPKAPILLRHAHPAKVTPLQGGRGGVN